MCSLHPEPLPSSAFLPSSLRPCVGESSEVPISQNFCSSIAGTKMAGDGIEWVVTKGSPAQGECGPGPASGSFIKALPPSALSPGKREEVHAPLGQPESARRGKDLHV